MNDLDLFCEICNEPAVGVCASRMGPVSHAYCRECVIAGREPWGTLLGGLVGIRRGEEADWVKLTIKATCAFYGKTEDELWAEMDAIERDYERYLAEDAP